ncbi:MAG: PQQ-binding-like beta-propeller repeat protein [Spirochaetes bacterium]|nr:PQQ-binding-like beta-propeller repeat protein [Spirochaetota bacterium]
MKSWNSDFIVVGVSTLIILLFSTLLYFDFTKRLSVANAQEIGTITFKKKVAQRKYSGQVVWEEIEQSTRVFNNDTIRTADISEAVVHLKDGTDISLDENSMIFLSIDENAININFTQGSIFAKRGNIQGDVKEITIQSQDATVSIEKSDIQLTKTESKDLDLTVTGGSARVQIANTEKVVGKDEKVVLEKGAKEVKIVKLQLKPLTPEPNKFFVTTGDSVAVNFAWEAVEEGSGVYLEISRDRGFANKIVSRKVPQNSVTEDLDAGTYYWQLRAVNEKNGGTDVSPGRKLTILREKPVRPIQPEARRNYSYTSQPPMINFRWSPGELATGYVIEIAKDPQYKSMVKSVETSLTSIAFGDLTEGEYYWRVRSKVQFGTMAKDSAGESIPFSVKRINEITPPDLIAPQDKRVVSAELIKKKELVFSWSADSRFASYRVFIARDKEFKDVVAGPVVNTNYYTAAGEFNAGEYFWRVQPVAQGDASVPFSRDRSFTVIATDKLALLLPVQNMEILLKEEQKNVPVSFTWERSSIKGEFQFEIAGDKGFAGIIERKILSASSMTLPAMKAGKYYWRIRLLDDNKNQILGSDIREFSIAIPKKEIAAVAEAEKAAALEKERIEKEKLDKEKKEKELLVGTVLTVSSPVGRSVIYIGGKLRGTKTVTVKATPGEKVNVLVKTPGYEEFRTEVVLEAGEKKTVYARLVDMKLMPRMQWKTNVQASVTSKPVFEKDIIVVATGRGGVVALNKYGNILWRQYLGSVTKSTPVIHESSVYVTTVDSKIYSLDITSGKVRWNQKIDGPLLFGAQPLAVNGKLFVATSYGKVAAFSAADGKELWIRDLKAGIFSSMDHHDDLLYIGTDQSIVYALDDDDGDVDWDFDVDSRIISSSPKVYKDNVYVGCYSGSFYAIDASRGRMRWKFDMKKSIFSNPAFHDDTVYIGASDGTLYALDARKGSLQWKFNTGSKMMSEPDILKDEIFVTSGNSVYSLKMDTGRVSWMEKFDNRINTGASVVDGNVCLGLENGDVVSLRTNLVKVVK